MKIDWCWNCLAINCKLCREYQTFSPKLLCAICAAKDQEKDISDIDGNGRYTNNIGRKTDQIGWYVPAVPDGNGNYWGYSSVPDGDILKWQRLPNVS